jgi:hypothetical protein
MKKLIMYFALALTVLAMPGMAQAANIYGWTLDLTDYGYGEYTDIHSLAVSGSGTITQSYGSDGVFSEGDPFQATSSIFTVDYTYMDATNTPHTVPFNLGSEQLYFISDDLSGYVSYIDPVSGHFNYRYTGGTVQMRLGDVTDPGTYTLLANMTLDSGLGEAADANLEGNFLSGETDLRIQFNDGVLDDIISFDATDYPGLADAYPWLSTYFVFDLTNNISQSIPPVFGPDGFVAYVQTQGPVTLVATPEPSTFLILGFGLLGLVGFRKKFKKA